MVATSAIKDPFASVLELRDPCFTDDDVIDREIARGIPFGPFHRKRVMERCPEHIDRHLRMAAHKRLKELVAINQQFQAPALPQGAAPANLKAAINTTVTETNLWNPALVFPIPAKSTYSGQVVAATFGGVMGTTATPTIAWRGRAGTNDSVPPTGTDLGIGPTVTLGTFTAQPFYGEFVMVVRVANHTAASLSAITGAGTVRMPAAAAATVTPCAVMGGLLPTTWDSTIDQGLSVSITWGTSSASNTLTCQFMVPAL